MMLQWDKRPAEIANLLNPAFCGEIIRRCIKQYSAINSNGLPYSLSYLILPIVLHKTTRESISSSRIQLHSLLHTRQDLRVGFAERVRKLVPITQESMVFLLQVGAIAISQTANIEVQRNRVTDRIKIVDSEMLSCFKMGETLGRIFAKAGVVENVYYMWGIKP